MKDNKATTPLEVAMKKAREGVVLAQKEADAGAARMSVFRLYLAADELALIVEEVDRLRGLPRPTDLPDDVEALKRIIVGLDVEIAGAMADLAAVRASYQARETEWREGRVRLDPSEQIDPLVALEAAERALLVAGGWRPAAREGHWLDAMQATWPRASAVVLERERVARLATKAGAS